MSIGDDSNSSPTASDTDDINIFTVGRPPSIEAVLSELPPREEVDRYLSKYFNVKYVVLRTYYPASIVPRALIYNSYYTYSQLSKNGNPFHHLVGQKLTERSMKHSGMTLIKFRSFGLHSSSQSCLYQPY